MQVYVVTSGYYSDYSIEAVFLDIEKATNFVGVMNNGKDYDSWSLYRVEEFETSDDDKTLAEVQERIPYFCIRFGDDGNVIRKEKKYFYQTTVEHFEQSVREQSKYHPYYIEATVRGHDEKKAIKVAAEMRAKYLADKLGIS